MTLATLDQSLIPNRFGAKAARLAEMRRAGLPVPAGVVIPVDDPLSPPASARVKLDRPHAVRSSAVREDGEGLSYAGQFVTVLNVNTPAALDRAVQQVRASDGHAEGDGAGGGMAVLIQPMVAARWSGVLFTHDPVSAVAHFVIEGAEGAGGVVAGTGSPQRMIVARDGQVRSGAAFLPPMAVANLAAHAARVTRLFGGVPQDIEWAWDGDQIWLLQARPITTLAPVWTRKIASEVMPGLVRPLTWSINQPMICGVWGEVFTIVLGDQARDLDFQKTAALHRSHAYFNATLLGTIFRRMGLPEQGLAFLQTGEKMTRPPMRSTVRNAPGLLRLVRTERGLPARFAAEDAAIYAPALAWLDASAPDGLNVAQLWARTQEILGVLRQVTFHKIVAPIGLSVRRALFKVPDGWLRDVQPPEVRAVKRLEQLAEQAAAELRERGVTQPLTPTDLLATLRETPSGMRILAALDDYLRDYGYLSEVNTDVSLPTWREHPDTAYDLFATFALYPHTPAAEVDEARRASDRFKLARVHPRADLAGRVAELYSRLMAHLRAALVAIERAWLRDGLLREAGDLFFLELDEVGKLVADPDAFDPMPIVAERRAHFERERDLAVPPLVYGRTLPAEEDGAEISAASLKGVAASRGVAECSVLVARSLAEARAARVDKSVALVVPFADAGWAPILVRAGALIAEVGGQLSHGAIVAREYGLPAVMNLERATAILRDGQRVRVDGAKGTVEVLE